MKWSEGKTANFNMKLLDLKLLMLVCFLLPAFANLFVAFDHDKSEGDTHTIELVRKKMGYCFSYDRRFPERLLIDRNCHGDAIPLEEFVVGMLGFALAVTWTICISVYINRRAREELDRQLHQLFADLDNRADMLDSRRRG